MTGSASAPVRVLVAEDSLTIRKHMVEVLDSTPDMQVVAEAGTGKDAIELCEKLAPDVITMDMMMPVMTGVAATEYIMAYCPRPILIVSASTNRGELFKTYDALAAGAVDVLEKPPADRLDDAWERELVTSVRIVSRVRAITHPRGRLGHLGISRPSEPTGLAGHHRIVAIGASTGGPAAVLDTLKALPRDFPLPVLVVLHISEAFAGAMADWLAAQTELSVRYARDGERLSDLGPGSVRMAPAGHHLVVERSRLRLTDGPERHSCRPSVDVLFESLARELGSGVIAALLTGMGRDGARGLFAIRERGGLTIAQDEATSVVFGMPGEAVKIDAAMHVLPLPEIAPLLARAGETPGGEP